MKISGFLALSFLLSACTLHSQHLFPIYKGGKVGYINASGKEVIPAIYYSGGAFSEGLAPVRSGGLYGYINEKGTMVIAPAFDYAGPFHEGFAIVHQEGIPHYITRDGKEPFRAPFMELNPFEDGMAKVVTSTNKEGYINTSGQLVIDTAFKAIKPFSDGLAVVIGVRDGEKVGDDYIKELGVINRQGKFVVPYGVYDEIDDFENGYAHVGINEKKGDEEGSTARSGVIDSKGKVVLLRFDKNNTWISGNLKDRRVRTSLYKYWIPEEKGILYSGNKGYEGYCNEKGEVIFNDTLVERVTDFSRERAFVKYEKGWQYFLIDTGFHRLNQKAYQGVKDDRFYGNLAFVQIDYKWGAIDRNGNMVIPPKFREISMVDSVQRYIYFSEWDKGEERFGISDFSGRIILKPMLSQFDHRGFQHGLLIAKMESGLVYLDTSGKVVWRGPKDEKEPSALNIDYMNRGYFYAYSADANRSNSGGWAVSSNLPKSIPSSMPKGDGLQVYIDTVLQAGSKPALGYKVYVVNRSGKELSFSAQDSRLYMKFQAKDKNDMWRDIEYLPSSWCGNSYHTVKLENNTQWTFACPKYEGAQKTSLRIELTYIDPTDQNPSEYKRKSLTVHSNEISGGVNPGQFWRKLEYFPAGIMDPYND